MRGRKSDMDKTDVLRGKEVRVKMVPTEDGPYKMAAIFPRRKGLVLRMEIVRSMGAGFNVSVFIHFRSDVKSETTFT